MSANFFITGLPRSRTAWLANLFTTGDQFCHHDLLGKVKDLAEFERRLQMIGLWSTGDSDSGLVWVFPQLRELFPSARWLLIERDPAESVASIRKVATGTRWGNAVAAYSDVDLWLPQYVAATEEMLKDKRVGRVPYAELENFSSVAAAWRFLLPYAPRLSRERFDLLHPLRVEVIPEKQPLAVSGQLIEEIKSYSVSESLSERRTCR